MAALAASLRPREFMTLMCDVLADLAGEGVSLSELEILCSRVSARVALPPRTILH